MLKFLFSNIRYRNTYLVVNKMKESSEHACFWSFGRLYEDTKYIYLSLKEHRKNLEDAVEFINKNCDYVNVEIFYNDSLCTIVRVKNTLHEFGARLVGTYMVLVFLRNFILRERVYKIDNEPITWKYYIDVVDKAISTGHAMCSLYANGSTRLQLGDLADEVMGLIFSRKRLLTILRTYRKNNKLFPSMKIQSPFATYRITYIKDPTYGNSVSNTAIVMCALETAYPEFRGKTLSLLDINDKLEKIRGTNAV